MKEILVVFPTSWDFRQLEACRGAWQDQYKLRFAEPADEDCWWDFDVPAFIDRAVHDYRGQIDGVFSSSDYPGAAAAAAIATALKLPGPPPEAIIRSSHKYYSRLAQQESAPQATPWFAVIDPAGRTAPSAALRFPCFLKPVKGAFSVLSARMNSRAELEAFIAQPAAREFMDWFVAIFNRLIEQFTDFPINASHFLAEEFLSGQLVTVEGFCSTERVEILGIVDSVTHPGTGSFVRFDYPSALTADIQQRMAAIARRVVLRLGLCDTLFNVEMIHDPASDQIHIIEVNPRMCGQFADLYEKVDGVNGYEIALALAAGRQPQLRRGQGVYRAASSLPLRIYEPVRVQHAPGPEDLRAAEALVPGTLIVSECQTGEELSNFERYEDGHSARYAVVNAGGADRLDLTERFEAIRHRLGYEFEPI